MAGTALDELFKSYARGQAGVAARTALRVGDYWKGVEVGNEASERNFVMLATAEISSGFLETAEEARRFTHDQTGDLIERPMPSEERIMTSMAYVGPIEARRAMGRWEMEPDRARSHVEKRVRGSAMRHSAMGGREVDRSVQSTRVACLRVTTSENPCAFCVMLASRGLVFKNDSFEESDRRFTGWGPEKVHDSCACGLVPITEASTDRVSQWKEYAALWDELKNVGIKEGESPLTTFRRNYERRLRAQGRVAE